jgi:prepilin-type processing-associated H-X9-DG protein
VVNWDWLSIRHDSQKKESEPAVSNTGPLQSLPNKDRLGVVCFADGHVDMVPRRYAHSPLHLLPKLDP